MKLCWVLITFHSDAIAAHRRSSLVSDFSRCLQVLVHWCGFHAVMGESEWYIGL